jgi:hypothetical protein
MQKTCLSLLVPLALAAAGCIDLEQEFTLNPDGSGKVAVRWIGAPPMIMGGEKKSTEAQARSMLKDEVMKAEGVDAWKDVSCVARDDGKFEFKGTAYFKDFSKLKLHNGGFKLVSIRASKDAAGNLVLVNEPDKKGEPSKPLSDTEAATLLKEQRAQYQQMKPLLDTMVGALKVSATVRLPGRVGEASAFKKVDDTTVRLAFDGKAFLKGFDELVMNDAWMLQQLKKGAGFEGATPDDEVIREKLFGDKGPIRAATTGALKTLFDYEGEAAPARKAWAAAAEALGAVVPPPAAGGDFKSLKVAAVHYVHAQDSARGLGHPSPGLKVTFFGELPGTVLNTSKGKLKTAVADTGESLLPDGDFDRTIHFAQLSSDKAAVSFDVKLALPPASAKGIREISGVLGYLVGGKTKDVDLGFTELKDGAKGKGATIGKIEENSWTKGHHDIEVKLEMPNERIHSIVLKDAAGAVVETGEGGYWASGSETTRTVTVKGAVPAKGTIVVKVYEDLKAYEIPFKVTDLDLLGRAVK